MASKAGRKTVMTKEVLGKLEHAFSIGCSDKEACAYADIHVDTLYEHQKNNPAFSERKRALKLNPVLKARQTVFDNLKDPKIAMWFLERKVPDEFNLQHLDLRSEEEKEERESTGIWSLEEIEQIKEILGDDYTILDDIEDDETESHLSHNPKPIARTALQS